MALMSKFTTLTCVPACLGRGKGGHVWGCIKICRLIALLLFLRSRAPGQFITVGTHRVQAPIWHKDVRFFQVSQNGQPKAYFYLGESS